ncbi:MAG: glycoside hydrolase family 3 protein [Solirubrobacteraceae bacterium]
MSRAWRTITGASAVLLSCVAATAAQAEQSPVQRADALVAKMSLDEKLDLVANGGAGDVRLGIPPLSGVDGPNGIGEGAARVTAFPNAVTIGASWDRELASRYGRALGAEAAGTGHTLLFAPTVNIVRTPLWGREPETFGEDPLLTGQLAASEIRGIQSRHVIAEVKHFAAYNQETGRFGPLLAQPAVNVLVSERALQEIYFPAFRTAVGPGGAGAVMCSYNRIDGPPSCQDPATLGALRGFGLRGFVEPDAKLAVRDVIAAVNAGVDNFQLGSLLSAAGGAGGVSGGPERSALASALGAGTLTPARIDDAARRILVAMLRVGLIGRPRPPTTIASTPAHRALAVAISAQGTVLLRNRAGVLPLTRRSHSIAVIGFDAGRGTQIEENGSPAVRSSAPVVTPLAAIRARAGRRVRVSYAAGTRGVVALPVLPASALTPSSGSAHGLSGMVDSTGDLSGSPISTRIDPTLDFAGKRAPLQPIPGTSASSARWSGTLTPPQTGEYRFSLAMSGIARLFIAGRLVAAGNTEFVTGAPQYPGANPVSYQGMVRLTAGRKVAIRVDYSTGVSIAGAELHLGWQPPEPGLIAHAVAAARRAKVAVVFANDVSSEGMDRPSLRLPGDQDRLIEAVTAANPRTIVVLHTAGPVLMPWRSKVAAILEAWYPGQQSGRAIAETLFGDVDPSGRLPVTFPASAHQGPTGSPTGAGSFPGIGNTVRYREGIFVGYRYYDRFGQRPLYPFGYGLSYTRFSLGRPKVRAIGPDRFKVSVSVRDTGSRPGAEVIELYVADPASSGEPPRQLEAFAKAFLKRGQRRTVTLGLGASSFAHYDTAHQSWRVTGGRYRIYLGMSSRTSPSASRSPSEARRD